MQNYRSKFKNLIYFGFLIVIFNFSFLILNLRSASAQTMSNQDYIIQTQKLETSSNVNAGNEYESKPAAVSEGVNLKVTRGFTDLQPALPFSFSISSNLVDFGALSPTNPLIRTVDLNIHSLNTYGYSVLVSEDQPLTTTQTENKAVIPDTTCDTGACDAQNASEWINMLTYGFGYRCDNVTGADCDRAFIPPNFYKRFPNIANNDDPQSIMAGIGSDNQVARISYKVNISGTQPQGTYSNIVTYIAVPNF